MTARRVALLSPRALPWHHPGGLERHVFDLAKHLLAEGVEVDLWISTPEREAAAFADDPRFRLEIVRGRPFVPVRFLVVPTRTVLYPWLSFRMGRAVARCAAARGYSAVVAQGGTGFGFAWWRRKLDLRVPLLLNPQGMEESITPEPLKRAVYWPLRAAIHHAAVSADRVIATDDSLVEVVRRVHDLPRERIVTLPNAIEVDEVRARADQERARNAWAELGLAGSTPRIVSIGRLVPNKGFAVAIDAVAKLAPQLPPAWSWTLVGEGPLRAELEERVRAAGLATRVRFAGRLDDATLHALLAEADLFLHPTLYEGSSLVTLEAMAHARPIVATRAGGIPDKIVEGETGWLAEPGDAGSLAEALRRFLAASEGERRRVEENALSRCRERFDWRAVRKAYVSLFDSLSS